MQVASRDKRVQAEIWHRLHGDVFAGSQVRDAAHGSCNHEVLRQDTGPTGRCDSFPIRRNEEQVFCAIPEGIEVDEDFDCFELVKAIYGPKQASRVWNETFHEFVCSTGFPVSDFDPCLYLKITSGECVLLLVYVNDVLVTGSSTELIMRTKSDLKARFEMTDSGKCAFVLGIELVDHDNGSVTMCQRRYVEDVLKRFGMSDCKAVTSPTDTSSRLIPSTAAMKFSISAPS
uniref:Reverse transcriptase Ty1/copia-type domain-containing protein n=1 Tax=Peronospora matthiolae TaxID=2874970 RepID=A0AAV1TQF2_9STRA